MAAEFAAMGSATRLVVTGGDTDALRELARRRIADLERKWSRRPRPEAAA